MMGYMETLQISTDSHPMAKLFNLDQIESTINKNTLEFSLQLDILDWEYKSASMFGLVLDYVTSLAGQQIIGNCELVEYEVNIITPTHPGQLKVIAKIDFDFPPHAVFFCNIYALNNDPQQLLAESHGTLIQRP